MLKLALIFLGIGLVAALLGFTTVAGASFTIAKMFALIFGILFVLFLILAAAGVGKVVSSLRS